MVVCRTSGIDDMSGCRPPFTLAVTSSIHSSSVAGRRSTTRSRRSTRSCGPVTASRVPSASGTSTIVNPFDSSTPSSTRRPRRASSSTRRSTSRVSSSAGTGRTSRSRWTTAPTGSGRYRRTPAHWPPRVSTTSVQLSDVPRCSAHGLIARSSTGTGSSPSSGPPGPSDAVTSATRAPTPVLSQSSSTVAATDSIAARSMPNAVIVTAGPRGDVAAVVHGATSTRTTPSGADDTTTRRSPAVVSTPPARSWAVSMPGWLGTTAIQRPDVRPTSSREVYSTAPLRNPFHANASASSPKENT